MNNEKVKSLQQAREKIDQIDVALIELIASRQFYVDQAMRHKQTLEDVQSPQRVKEVIEKPKRFFNGMVMLTILGMILL